MISSLDNNATDKLSHRKSSNKTRDFALMTAKVYNEVE